MVIKLDSMFEIQSDEITKYIDSLLFEKYNRNNNEDLAYLYSYKIKNLLISNNLDSIPFFIDKAATYSNEYINEDLKTKLNINLSKYYFIVNDYPSSLKYSLKALSKVEKLMEKMELFNIIATIYFELNDLDISLEYFKKSYIIADKIGDNKRLAISNGNMGAIYLLNSEYEKANDLLEQSNKYFEIQKDTINIIKIYTTRSKLALKEGNLDKAKFFLEKARNLSIVLNNELLNSLVNQHYGNYYLEMNDLVNAERMFKEAYTLSKKDNILRSQLNALSGLRDVKLLLSDYKNSAEVQNLYYQLKDSIYGASIRHKIDEVVWLAKLEEKHDENKLLHSKFELEKQKKRILITLYSTIVITILIFVWFLYSNNKKNLKISKLLNNQLQSKVILEKKMKEKQEDLHRQEIEKKNQELIALNLMILSKNKIFNEIEDIVETSNEDKIISELRKKVRLNKIQEKDWIKFKEIFEKMHPSFYLNIEKNYPQLSKTEVRICSYIKIDLPKSEICTIMNINHNSLITSRYRIRKKLNLKSNDDLDEIIKSW